jgi:hypothetical protein
MHSSSPNIGSRFCIRPLEERIAPTTIVKDPIVIKQAIGDGANLSGSVEIVAGPGGATGEISGVMKESILIPPIIQK